MNTWRKNKPEPQRIVLVWWGIGQKELRAYWTGKVWRSAEGGAILHDVTHWREVDA